MSKVLVFATRNQGKVRELRKLFENTEGLRIDSVDDYEVGEVIEDGATFFDNAKKKAIEVSRATGLPALADDSGLEVEALGGAPGVHSARFAGDAADPQANNAKLLSDMAGIEERAARFVSCLVFADTAGALGESTISASGTVEGTILEEYRGEGGFGYDPLFYCPALGKSFAEAGLEAKNEVSHRASALKVLHPKLIDYFRLGI